MAEQVMDRPSIVGKIVDIARQVNAKVHNLKWYGFGSFFATGTSYSDIDVLVVCATLKDAVLVRELVNEFSDLASLHLLVMTKEEEVETDFIRIQGCEFLGVPPN